MYSVVSSQNTGDHMVILIAVISLMINRRATHVRMENDMGRQYVKRLGEMNPSHFDTVVVACHATL